MNPLRTITIHSYRGGTGKTLIALNLAAELAKKHRVALLELDFDAPTLHSLLGSPTIKNWLNDYLTGKSLYDVLINYKKKYFPNGELFVGFADNSIEAINKMVQRTPEEHMIALRRLITSADQFKAMGLDYAIFDTTPGIGLSAVNAIVTSQLVILVLRADKPDLSGTKAMVKRIYEQLNKEVKLVVNRVVPDTTQKTLEEIKTELGHPILVEIPCVCDLPLQTPGTILTLENPDHIFSQKIAEIAEKIK